MKIAISDSKRKIRTWTGIRTLDLHMSSLILYQLSYPGSIANAGLNISLEMQCQGLNFGSGWNFSFGIWYCNFHKAQIISLFSFNNLTLPSVGFHWSFQRFFGLWNFFFYRYIGYKFSWYSACDHSGHIKIPIISVCVKQIIEKCVPR